MKQESYTVSMRLQLELSFPVNILSSFFGAVGHVEHGIGIKSEINVYRWKPLQGKF